MMKFHGRKPDPRPAALLRIARDELGIPLKKVGAAVGRNWATVSNGEAGMYRLSAEAEEKVIRYYIAEFAARGTRVEDVPEDAGVSELRVALAKTLLAFQSQGVVEQSARLQRVAAGLGLGASDFTEQLVSLTLRNRGRGRGRIPNKLLLKLAEAEEAQAAGNE
jgi:hypothetical protein